MAHKLVFNSAIPDDLLNALAYYENISPKLADRFRAEVDKRLDDLVSRPESFPFDVRPIRFAKINRFPYLVFFVLKGEHVLVLAIVHGSSHPSKWRGRSSGA